MRCEVEVVFLSLSHNVLMQERSTVPYGTPLEKVKKRISPQKSILSKRHSLSIGLTMNRGLKAWATKCLRCITPCI